MDCPCHRLFSKGNSSAWFGTFDFKVVVLVVNALV